MKKLIPIILIFGIVGFLGYLVVRAGNNAPASNTTLLGDTHAEQPRTHIQPGTAHAAYNSEPPSSGPHYPQPAPWGIKDAEQPDELLVHNLEHGGINIFYKPDLPADQIASLKQIFSTLPKSTSFNEIKAVLAPRSANTHPIELAAWTYTYYLATPDAAKILQFYNNHVDKGPELIP